MQPNQLQAAELKMQIEVKYLYANKLIIIDKIYKAENMFSSTGDNFNFLVIIPFNKCR